MRDIEEPVTTTKRGPGGDDESVTTHPAFAQIAAYRVNGNTNLYGSEFRHNAYMVIKVSRSELHRNLHRDWHFDRDEIIEVALSEAQWATLVSSPNVGTGVPCTLQRLNRELVPGLPDPQSRVDQFKTELREKLAKSIDHIKDAIAGIDDANLPKAKAATLKGTFNHVLMELQSNLPFVADSFDEHMENTVESAKQEVHGYMTGLLQRAGLDAITNGRLPLQIERAVSDNNHD